MNERIRALMEEAGIYDFVVESMGIDKEMDKFAELIAADIAEMCATIDGGENMFSRAIREEYGVK